MSKMRGKKRQLSRSYATHIHCKQLTLANARAHEKASERTKNRDMNEMAFATVEVKYCLYRCKQALIRTHSLELRLLIYLCAASLQKLFMSFAHRNNEADENWAEKNRETSGARKKSMDISAMDGCNNENNNDLVWNYGYPKLVARHKNCHKLLMRLLNGNKKYPR